MLNRIFFIITLFLALTIVETRAEECDTLFMVAKANEIVILSNNSVVSVTVSRINGGTENYYYETSIPGMKDEDVTTMATVKDIYDISVTEIDNRDVRVAFTTSAGNLMLSTFPIPDPANREIKSYTGTKSMDFGIRLHQKDKSDWLLVSEGLGLGFVTPVGATPALPSSMGRSLEFTWNVVFGIRWTYGPHSITSGLGLNWRDYALKSDRYFYKNNDGSISLNEYDVKMEKRRSVINTFSLQVPMLYKLRFGSRKNIGLTVGPIINFNTVGHIVTKYKLESSEYVIKTSGIKQNPVTVDLMGGISWSGIGVYARYAPMRVLRSSTGLDFKYFSTGIMVMF